VLRDDTTRERANTARRSEMTEIVTLEGFVEDADYEFDCDVFMLEPVRAHEFAGGESPEEMVENFAIDYSIGDKWKDQVGEEYPEKAWVKIRKAFERIKAKGRTRKAFYWKRVLEIDMDPNSTWVYRVIESVG
jgi:hypothetical protein